MTRGVKILNKQNYLEDGVCEKHFIYSFAHGVSIFWGERYLSFERFPVCLVNYKESFFFCVRISFFRNCFASIYIQTSKQSLSHRAVWREWILDIVSTMIFSALIIANYFNVDLIILKLRLIC